MHRAVLVVLAASACRSSDGSGGARVELNADIGTAHPLLLQTSAKNGHWLIVCQARRDTDGKPGIAIQRTEGAWLGDKLEPYLIRGSGAGATLDTFMAASPDDRWIAVVRDRTLSLIDDQDGREHVLADADTRAEGRSHDRNTAEFTQDSTYLVYARRRNNHDSIVIHSLISHEERELQIDDDVWRIDPAGGPTSDWLKITRMPPQPSQLERPRWPRLVHHRSAGMSCESSDTDETNSSVLRAYWFRPSVGEWQQTEPTAADINQLDQTNDSIVLGAAGDKQLRAHVSRDSTGYDFFWFNDNRTGVITLIHDLASGHAIKNGRFVAIGTTMIDVAQTRIIGELPRLPLAIDDAGHALVPAVTETLTSSAVGPARWMSARPIPGS